MNERDSRSRSTTEDRHYALRIAAYAAAVSIPAGVLYWSTGPGETAFRPVASPFGWYHLAVLHLVAVLPVSILMAGSIVRSLSPRISGVATILGAALALAVAWWTVTGGDVVGLTLEKVKAGFAVRLGTRIIWCLVLVAPWCWVAYRLTGSTRREAGDGDASGLTATVLAVFVACGLPAAYTFHFVREQTAIANNHLSGGRLWKAEPVLAALCEVGSSLPVASPAASGRRVAPRVARDELAAEMAFHAAEAERPPTPDAPAAEQVQYVRHLVVLGKLAQARSALETVADVDASAALLMAAILDQQQQCEQSHRWYATAASLLSADSAPPTDLRMIAYDGLAKTARDLRRYRDAERVYQEAIRELPDQEAYYRFQLGRHYQLGGRPADAMAAFQKAAELRPEQFALEGPQVAGYLKKLREETPTCVLPSWGPTSPDP